MTASPEAPPSLRLGEYCVLRLGAAAATGDGGLTIIAELRHAPTAAVAGQPRPDWFADVGRTLYLEVEGLGRCIADLAADASPAGPCRFTLDAAMGAAIRAGAEFGFGIAHPEQEVGAAVGRAGRTWLLRRDR